MSYILDALRKSEQERQRGRLPDIASRPEQPAPVSSGSRWSVALLVLVVFNLCGWALWWLMAPSAPEPQSPDAAPVPQQAIAVQGATTAPPASLSPPVSSSSGWPAASGPAMPIPQAPQTSSSGVGVQAQATPSTAAVIPAQPYQQVIVIPQGSAAVVQSAPIGQGLPVSQGLPVGQVQPAPPAGNTIITPGSGAASFNVPPSPPVSSGEVMPPPPAPPLPPDLAQAIEPGGSGVPDVTYLPTLEELSPSLRSRVPSMAFSSHMFSSMEQFRSVVINGQRVRQGAILQPGLQLTSITENGVVMTIDGTSFQVDILGNWSR